MPPSASACLQFDADLRSQIPFDDNIIGPRDDPFASKMKTSGYELGQVEQVIVSVSLQAIDGNPGATGELHLENLDLEGFPL